MNKDFLALVRLGIGTGTVSGLKFQDPIDWQGVKDLAEQQGLSAIVLDGIERLPDQQRPPKVFLLEWIGETLQGYEYRYVLYLRALAEMAAFYREHGFKMMVLKGYACSVNWPKPEHRPCGDIDIWQFGQQKEADEVLAKEKGIEIDGGRHHHTVFYWRDFMVENHYDFINVHHHRSHTGLEKVFKELGSEANFNENDNQNHVGTRIKSIEVYGERVYLPSANLHALFLARHALNHFASIGINLRQVLDWAFYAEKHSSEIDWKWLNGMLEQYHMKDFYNCLNAICVEDLGFDASIFQGVQFSPVMKDKVLADILNPEFGAEEPQQLISRLIYKYRRWKGNAWKHELCYNEGRIENFLDGIKVKLKIPSAE